MDTKLKEKATQLDQALMEFDDELHELTSKSVQSRPNVASINNWARLDRVNRVNSGLRQRVNELHELIENYESHVETSK